MTSQVAMGTAALSLLGLSSLDELADRAMVIAMRKLTELDASSPNLGIGDRIRAALQATNPAAAIAQVLEEFRDQIAA